MEWMATGRPMSHRGHERELLSEGLIELSLVPRPKILDSFLLFIDELIRWNRKTNLIGSTSRDQIIIRHIFDSLTVYRLLPSKKESILDLGAGAGFPSLPLAIVDPSLCITAVEKRRRRAAFLESMRTLLGLTGYRVVERDVRDVHEVFDVILARAVGELPLLYTLANNAIKEGTVIIAFKGKITEIDREMKSLREKVKGDGGHNIRIQRVQVPHLKEEERNIVIIEMAS
jgi:16S rRNA (guanine527-N7)-methyltransferase